MNFFREKSFFRERLYVFIKFGHGKKKISRILGNFPKTMSTLNNYVSEGTLSLNFSFFIFFSVYSFRILTENIKKLMEILWQGCQNRILRVQRNDFWENKIVSRKLFSFQILIVKEKIVTPAKDFSESCLKSTLQFQLIAFKIKTFFESFLLLHLFGPQAEKNFNFGHKIFARLLMCILRIQINTSWKKNFFLGNTINFHWIWTWKQKYFEKSWKFSENNVYTE